MASITRIAATSADEVLVVGQQLGSCEPALAITYSGGAEFADRTSSAPTTWYLTQDRAGVHTPQNRTVAPCQDVVALGAASATAATVLCSDGTLTVTADAGAAWSAVQSPGTVVALSDEGTLALVSDGETCSLVRTETMAALATAAETCDAQTIALSTAEATDWVWSGEDVATVTHA